ncbi:MAG: hypothetical protein DRI46_08000 [Chloroflexi bacterium]|nr:MAG: hypothetical protein DRI46_08000 [Chloroflexota bacterium]
MNTQNMTATTVKLTSKNVTKVTYHNTTVVKINHNNDTAEFNDGGWGTQTTAKRMNQACSFYKLPFNAFRRKINGEWTVSIHDEDKKTDTEVPCTLTF